MAVSILGGEGGGAEATTFQVLWLQAVRSGFRDGGFQAKTLQVKSKCTHKTNAANSHGLRVGSLKLEAVHHHLGPVCGDAVSVAWPCGDATKGINGHLFISSMIMVLIITTILTIITMVTGYYYHL